MWVALSSLDRYVHKYARILSTGTIPANLTMESGAKRVHFACAPCGKISKGWHIYLPHPCLYMLSRCVEALTRAGKYDRSFLHKAVAMFEVRVRFTTNKEMSLNFSRIFSCTSTMSVFAQRKFPPLVKGAINFHGRLSLTYHWYYLGLGTLFKDSRTSFPLHLIGSVWDHLA